MTYRTRFPVSGLGGDRPTLSDYTLLTQLGEGGMGRVHLAIQRSLEREVAIKTLKPDASPAALGVLLREARLIGMLEHPGVIPVHALGVGEDGVPLLVMKRVSGVDLATLLTDASHVAWGDFSPDRTIASLEILMQVCQTVEFAHRRGIVHRDIKPENVMVGELGEVYLVDWGIATSMAERTRSTALVGTPCYMAPEMARGQPVDERTDVYLPELALRIEELTQRVAERARAEERLASMHLDLDPSVNARQRIYVFAGFSVFVAAATLALIFRRSAVSRTELVWTAFAALVFVGIAHALLRGKVGSNASNRRGIALLYLSIVAAIVNRSMGVVRSTPAETTIAFDLLIASMAYAFAAVALRREVWICVPILTAGLVGALCWPGQAFAVYNFATLAGVIVFTMVLARRKAPPT